MEWLPPDFPPGSQLRSTSGVPYEITSRIWWRGRGGSTSRGEAAFAARCSATPSRQVVLRVFAQQPGGRGGAFVATQRSAADWRDGESGSFGQAESGWLPLPPAAHPTFLACVDSGQLVTELSESPFGFAALEWVEGATLTTLLNAAVERAGVPLGPGFALAIGTQLASALAWLHACPLSETKTKRSLWHGRLDERHVFVSATGECRLLTPVRCIEHEYRGGLLSLDDLLQYQEVESSYLEPAHTPDGVPGRVGDLFQLGVLLWKILVGCTPPVGKRDPAFVGVFSGVLPELVHLVPEVPAGLAACVHRLLALPPRPGFKSTAEVAAALAGARAEYPGPQDAAALAAVVAVLGPRYRKTQPPTRGLAVAGDGQDGTREPVILSWTNTS